MRLSGRAALLLPLALAFWPVGRWYLLRTTDGSDEPWGVLAIVTLALLVWRRRPTDQAPRLVWPARCLVLYAVTYTFVPPLGRAIFAAGAFGSVLLRGRGAAAQWGLLALSLPIVATLQFYFGYPLRVLVAGTSAGTLNLLGFGVQREGTLLQWRGETVMVDVPCSGVHMLWCGLYLACLLAAFHRLSAWRTVLCGVAAILVLVGANVVRGTVLFFKEAHVVSWPEWTHAGVGVVLFLAAVWSLAAIAQRLQSRQCAHA